MENSEKINNDLYSQVDEILKKMPMEASPADLSSRVMKAIQSTPKRVYINSFVVKLIVAFFAACILIAVYHSDVKSGPVKFSDRKWITDSVSGDTMLLLLCINCITALFLLDRWLNVRFKNRIFHY